MEKSNRALEIREEFKNWGTYERGENLGQYVVDFGINFCFWHYYRIASDRNQFIVPILKRLVFLCSLVLALENFLYIQVEFY